MEPAPGVGLLMAAETKQSPQPHQCQLGPIDTQPQVLKDPQLVGWGCCSPGMEPCWLVLVCGAVLGVADEWGWDPPFCPPTGCTGAGGCPLFCPVLVPDGHLGAVLVERSLPKMIPSSEGWGKGLPGAPPGPSRAGGTWLGWGGSGALVGSVAAGSSVPPHGQLLVCPQPWSGSWYWECSW